MATTHSPSSCDDDENQWCVVSEVVALGKEDIVQYFEDNDVGKEAARCHYDLAIASGKHPTVELSLYRGDRVSLETFSTKGEEEEDIFLEEKVQYVKLTYTKTCEVMVRVSTFGTMPVDLDKVAVEVDEPNEDFPPLVVNSASLGYTGADGTPQVMKITKEDITVGDWTEAEELAGGRKEVNSNGSHDDWKASKEEEGK
jgi:hypothetical protein